MAFVVETGVGLTTANSYLSEADADAYIADHGNSTAWSTATSASKQEALRLATQYLDIRFGDRWKGIRANETQLLAWPRAYVVDRDGYYLDSDDLPKALEDATAELALRVINGDTLLDDIDNPGTIKRERSKIGPLEDETEYMGGKSQVKSFPRVDGLMKQLTGSIGTVERA